MGSGVSQIKYWLGDGKNNNDANGTNGADGGANGVYLSYTVFIALSVLGGFLALDHLYLRSPLTFLPKIIINILCFGAWWLYDASQAVFNKDKVQVFGLNIPIPGLSQKTIASGVLVKDVPDKKHMAFFIYGLAVLFGGIFGLDSFLTGDNESGLIRLVSLISFIGAPVAIIWWIYNSFMFLFKTKKVTSKHYEYFGAPHTERFDSIGSFLQNPLGAIGAATGIYSIPQAVGAVVGTVLTPGMRIAAEPLAAAVAATVEPITSTVKAGLGTVNTLAGTIQQGLEVGKTALNAGTKLGSQALDIVGETSAAAAKAAELIPKAGNLLNKFTPPAASAALQGLQQTKNTLQEIKQYGGSQQIDVLPYMLMGTIILIAVSGLILTYRRSKQNGPKQNGPKQNGIQRNGKWQNGTQQKDDSPPEPGVLRRSNKEKPINAA